MNLASGALAFLVMVAYWPGFSGAAIAPRWSAIALGAILVLIGPRIRWTVAHAIGAGFIAWCALSLAWSDQVGDGIGAMFRLLLLATGFILGSQLTTLRPAMMGAAAGLAISSALAIAQHFGWDGVLQGTRPAGLFYNKNYLAEAAALVMIWAFAERFWWVALGVLPAIVLPVARGALLAVSATAVILLWRRSRAAALGVAGIALAVIGYTLLTASLISVDQRGAIWRDTFDHVSLLGYGFGAFAETFPSIARHFVMIADRPAQAHNEFLQVWFEVGAAGLAVLTAFFATLLRPPFNAAQLVLFGILVEAFFAFPFQMPATAFIGLLAAGHAARDCIGVGDALARGRASLHARI
jgi:hypothetical protein